MMRFEQATTYKIQADVQFINQDLLIILTGGNVPHIGTVTTMEAGTIENFQFSSHSGRKHKDDVLSRIILKKISEHFSGHCVVLCGVHVDHITKQEIVDASKLVSALAEDISDWLKSDPVTFIQPVYYGKDEQPE